MMIHFTMTAFLLRFGQPAATRLARRPGSSMVDSRQLCRPCRPTRLWMAAVACLHYSVGTGRGALRIGLRAWLAGIVSADGRLESMRDVFDIYTIIFLALAVFIFLRLRSVLGQRTGRERPPYDPYSSAREHDAAGADRRQGGGAAGPRARRRPQKPAEPAEPVDRWKGIAEPGSAVAAGLDAIVARGQELRRQAFPDRRARRLRDDRDGLCGGRPQQLKNLLGKEVYDGFETAIRSASSGRDRRDPLRLDRRRRHHRRRAARPTAQVTVRFVSQLVSVTRDRTAT